jgi:hypothetical protein
MDSSLQNLTCCDELTRMNLGFMHLTAQSKPHTLPRITMAKLPCGDIEQAERVSVGVGGYISLCVYV